MPAESINRRDFLRTSAAVAATAAVATAAAAEEGESKSKANVPLTLPRRRLGRTNEPVTIINLGTTSGCDPRLLNAAYERGVRYIDLAASYKNGQSEREAAAWLKDTGKRDEMFIVTKDHPKDPADWPVKVDERLKVLGIDRLDMCFLHGLCAGHGGSKPEEAEWPKSREWGEAGEKLKKSGKVRFVGFSTHAQMDLRIQLLHNAVAGGWVDALMVAADPLLIRENAEFNKALDACHKADIGLVCMKEMRAVADAPKDDPLFKDANMTPHQAVLNAIWSDGRFASICSNMLNIKILDENTTAAREFKPMTGDLRDRLDRWFARHAKGYCPGCDGRCGRAAGTEAALGDIARYLAYCEQDGDVRAARDLYRSLPEEARSWQGADLEAASAACLRHLDFASIRERVETRLA